MTRFRALSTFLPISMGIIIVVPPTVIALLQNNNKPKTFNFATCEWSAISKKATALENNKIDETTFCNSFVLGDNPLTEDVVEPKHIPTQLSDFIGYERTVVVNTQPHIVRVVDVEHDLLADDTSKKAIFTFDFKNLISDANGKSLACQWNDVLLTETFTSNFDYTQATIQNNLNGSGDDCAIWFTKGESTPTRGKSVLSMLPSKLSSVIKSVQKTVGQCTDDAWQEGSDTQIASYNAKLFLPCCYEIVSASSRYIKNEGSIYKLYDNNSYHISKQKSQVVRDSDKRHTSDSNDITLYNQIIYSYAGYDDEENMKAARYLISSPNTIDGASTWYITGDMQVDIRASSPYAFACPLSPFFCI